MLIVVSVVASNLWKFLDRVARNAHDLTEFISRNQETTSNLLKKCPEKL